MSVSLVQPPQVHQQRVVSAAAAVLLGHPPGELTGMLGIEIPEFATS